MRPWSPRPLRVVPIASQRDESRRGGSRDREILARANIPFGQNLTISATSPEFPGLPLRRGPRVKARGYHRANAGRRPALLYTKPRFGFAKRPRLGRTSGRLAALTP